jgi:hypothetical protein
MAENATYNIHTVEEVVPHAEMVRYVPKLCAVAILVISPWHFDISCYALVCYKIVRLQSIFSNKHCTGRVPDLQIKFF